MLTAWFSPSQAQSVLKSPESSLKEMKMETESSPRGLEALSI